MLDEKFSKVIKNYLIFVPHAMKQVTQYERSWKDYLLKQKSSKKKEMKS
ncbi:uncharacterized protein METZ01_LOCUS133285 [marine metagenome]|uniref:Uncharacterized protein n=1 Tax=marine metagenome TaxID=408172 RepID=A0A381YV11_9ZZZZ